MIFVVVYFIVIVLVRGVGRNMIGVLDIEKFYESDE